MFWETPYSIKLRERVYSNQLSSINLLGFSVMIMHILQLNLCLMFVSFFPEFELCYSLLRLIT